MFKKALTIAGSDSGGGAGIQADIKAMENLGVFGMSVITAVTAQNTIGVTGVHQLPAEFVGRQIDAVITDLGADAVKIGMLGTSEVVEVVAHKISQYNLNQVVLDPVIVATSGDRLLAEEAIEVIKNKLIPVSFIVTPNRDEAEILSGITLSYEEDFRKAARLIYELGAGGVLVKGGEFEEDLFTDIYYDGREFYRYTAPKIKTSHTHGTGCTMSSVIAACLAKEVISLEAVQTAKDYVYRQIEKAQNFPIGGGSSPISLPQGQ